MMKFFSLKSITNRLTLFYTISTIAVLGLTFFFIFTIISEVINKSSYQYLQDDLRYISGMIKQHHGDYSILAHDIHWLPSTVTQKKNFVKNWFVPYALIRILNSKNKTLTETPGMLVMLPSTTFPHSKSNRFTVIKKWQSTDGRRYLLMSRKVQFSPQKSYIVQIGLDVTSFTMLLHDYMITILLTLIIFIITIVFIGRYIVKQGLKPLTTMANKAHAISTEVLQQRLNISEWPYELENLAQELNNMLSRIENGYGRLMQFSSDLAHELRTPLNNLMGETEVTLLNPRSVQEYQQVLISNLDEYRHIHKLIEQLLFLARADNPKHNIKRNPISLKKNLTCILSYFQAAFEKKQISVTEDVSGCYAVDKILWQRALSNIIDNAIKHTPFGGSIVIKTVVKNSICYLTITDSGSGIPAEDIPHLFDRFYRSTPSHHNTSGFGLGLAITASILKLHNYSIQVQSQINQGTTFTIQLEE